MIWAKRYHWTEASREENLALVMAFADRPEFLTYPYPREVAMELCAQILMDPNNIIWACYSDKSFTGVVLLQRVQPHVDALLHFLFLDKNLAGKRKLLKNIVDICFTEFGFHRLSMEVPEGVRVERFARSVLRFRYEGEIRPRNPELPTSLTDNWVAKQGSRMEQGHFDGSEWKDIIKLRLLAQEWVGMGEEGEECRKPLSEPLPPPLSGD